MKKLITFLVALSAVSANASCLEKTVKSVKANKKKVEAMPFYRKNDTMIAAGLPFTGMFGAMVTAGGALPAGGVVTSGVVGVAAMPPITDKLFGDFKKAKNHIYHGEALIQLIKNAQAFDGHMLRNLQFKLDYHFSEDQSSISSSGNPYTLTTLADEISLMNEKEEFKCSEDEVSSQNEIFKMFVEKVKKNKSI